MSENRSTAVLEVSRVHWASSKNVAEAVLSRRPGVIEVDANRGADRDGYLRPVSDLGGGPDRLGARLRISLCRPVGPGAHLRSPRGACTDHGQA
jgi:hypothetical protein